MWEICFLTLNLTDNVCNKVNIGNTKTVIISVIDSPSGSRSKDIYKNSDFCFSDIIKIAGDTGK